MPKHSIEEVIRAQDAPEKVDALLIAALREASGASAATKRAWRYAAALRKVQLARTRADVSVIVLEESRSLSPLDQNRLLREAMKAKREIPTGPGLAKHEWA